MIDVRREQFLGALLGCAVGDALGAPYEGYWSKDIPGDLMDGFGEFHGYPTGQFTDDTQLTRATVEAIVMSRSLDPAPIAERIGELWKTAAVIGPGGACMEAGDEYLRTGDWRTCGAPVGQAGNGTAMRTGVLGLCFLDRPEALPDAVADICRLTHQDPRSVAGGVGVAEFVRSVVTAPDDGPEAHLQRVAASMAPIHDGFARLVSKLESLVGQPREKVAERLAWPEGDRFGLESPSITPYVVSTVLACLWSASTHADSWPRAVEEVIRLGGDVDTTGAIVGAIQGARLGVDAIPSSLLDTVQAHDELASLATRLFELRSELAR